MSNKSHINTGQRMEKKNIFILHDDIKSSIQHRQQKNEM